MVTVVVDVVDVTTVVESATAGGATEPGDGGTFEGGAGMMIVVVADVLVATTVVEFATAGRVDVGAAVVVIVADVRLAVGTGLVVAGLVVTVVAAGHPCGTGW
jgi:hypothetical protein|mmetsp:Transcript_28664/g.44816  ORF Transcript_28664/g.44816 Transcript_28664/m.44816 type:complete len:103 (+) Transcript_28664:228-536(+)